MSKFILSIVTAIGSAVIMFAINYHDLGFRVVMWTGGGAFVFYWIALFCTIYGTKPLETILDSAIGNFMRYVAGPVLGTWSLTLFVALAMNPHMFKQ